jgi:nitroreductase
MTSEQLISALNWRYATKQFDASKNISSTDFAVLLESLRLTPSSFGLQPWKFIVVETPEIRQQLRDKSFGQPQVTDASHLIVLCAKNDMSLEYVLNWINILAEQHQISVEDLAPLQNMMVGFISQMSSEKIANWNAHQIYIALGQLMTSAACLNIDTCPLEGISPTDYDEILGLRNSGYRTVVACALGYRSLEDKYAKAFKARHALNDLIEKR